MWLRRAQMAGFIHPSAWNKNSANFAFWGFSEVELPIYGVLGSLLPEMVTWHIYQWCKDDSVPPKKTSVLEGGGENAGELGASCKRRSFF